MFFAGTPLALSLPTAPAAAAFFCVGWILVTWICSRRNAATTASIVSPMRSPDTFSPERVRPENANVAITLSLRYWGELYSFPTADCWLLIADCHYVRAGR